MMGSRASLWRLRVLAVEHQLTRPIDGPGVRRATGNGGERWAGDGGVVADGQGGLWQLWQLWQRTWATGDG